ncbi:hypothetical protein [Streptomyces sp. NBC_00057]|uniref:hypothetical protein n=1 Tax=Streptomyces sp. NBC_00057 TaxID=2975634 RepID=UPI00324CE4CF
MPRRWPLITTITVLTIALAFVVVQLVRGQDSGKEQAGAKPGGDAESLQGLGWWPLHQSGTAKAGEHDAVVRGGTQWTDGPEGGAVQPADTRTPTPGSTPWARTTRSPRGCASTPRA